MAVFDGVGRCYDPSIVSQSRRSVAADALSFASRALRSVAVQINASGINRQDLIEQRLERVHILWVTG